MSSGGVSGAVTRCRSDFAMDAEGEGPQALRSKPRTVMAVDNLKKRGVFMIMYLQM